MLDRAGLAAAMIAIGRDFAFEGIDGCFLLSIALRHFVPPAIPSPLRASVPGILGSRFVPPGSPATSLYMAAEPETAYREGNQEFFGAIDGPGIAKGEPPFPLEVVVIGLRVRFSRIMDLRSGPIRVHLGTTPSELASPWKTVADAPTQRLGGAIFDDRQFEGLLYLSARHRGGTCLVIFPERLAAGSSIDFRSNTRGISDARLGPIA